jgi:hypothetical protein
LIASGISAVIAAWCGPWFIDTLFVTTSILRISSSNNLSSDYGGRKKTKNQNPAQERAEKPITAQ